MINTRREKQGEICILHRWKQTTRKETAGELFVFGFYQKLQAKIG